MSVVTKEIEDTGLEVIDILSDPQFAQRKLHVRDVSVQMTGLQRLAHAFVESPENILQELVNAAVDLCGADSAGISIEKEDRTDKNFYHWVATAGDYSGFLNAILPRYPSACGICLERGRPQLFRVSQRFFEILGVDAPLVTDGILLPWQVDSTRGTIFVMAHGRSEAFDNGDISTMQMLADFAAMGFRQQRQTRLLIDQERAAAAAAMANELAHNINNPLQGITNVVYLAANSKTNPEVKALATDLQGEVRRLSELVKEILALPLASAGTSDPSHF
jgi:two-component sensor histidine kinase